MMPRRPEYVAWESGYTDARDEDVVKARRAIRQAASFARIHDRMARRHRKMAERCKTDGTREARLRDAERSEYVAREIRTTIRLAIGAGR